MEDSLNYETIAAIDVIGNNIEVMERIVEAANAGMEVENIAGELCIWIMECRPKGTLELYDYLLEHAIEQIDFGLIVEMVLQADAKVKDLSK